MIDTRRTGLNDCPAPPDDVVIMLKIADWAESGVPFVLCTVTVSCHKKPDHYVERSIERESVNRQRLNPGSISVGGGRCAISI